MSNHRSLLYVLPPENRWTLHKPLDIDNTLRIQICPKKGIIPIHSSSFPMGLEPSILFDREGSGFLGIIIKYSQRHHILNFQPANSPSVSKKESHFTVKKLVPVSHRIHVYGIFTYIWLIFMVNVGKYTIHWAYGYGRFVSLVSLRGLRVRLWCYASMEFVLPLVSFLAAVALKGVPRW